MYLMIYAHFEDSDLLVHDLKIERGFLYLSVHSTVASQAFGKQPSRSGLSLSANVIRPYFSGYGLYVKIHKPQRDKTYRLIGAPNDDSNQPAHPRSLIRAFVVRVKKCCIRNYSKCTQRRLIRLYECTGSSRKHAYNLDPLKPHVYIVKLGFTGVYISFLISAQKHRLWVLVRTNEYPQFMV